jgi:DNA polymerase (family 10)
MPEAKSNEALAEIFARIAQLLELIGADKFRIIAHDRAARLIESHPEDLCRLAADRGRAALIAIDGIGPKIADKIVEYAKTGRIAEQDELLASVPAGLLDVLNIPGCGPKTVRALWTTLNITDLPSLQKAIDDGSILTVPRMGEKTVANMREAIAFAAQAQERVPLGIALPIAERIAGALRKVKGVKHAAFAGSLRRGRDTVGDLDFLVAAKDPAAPREAFTTMAGVEKVLAAGESKSSIRLREGSRVIQADLRIVPEESWGAALMYFTGSKEHNVRLRERALKKGLTLNEYGLYPDDNDKTPPHQRGITPVSGRDEASIFKALGVPEVPPELREERDIDAPPPAGLIELADIKAELHAHTTASDGKLSINELADAALARGFHTIAVTDHSQSSVIANGLKPDRLKQHIDAVRNAAAKRKDITILAGSEVDILADGSLDYDDDLLALLDIVVASPHASLKQEPDVATARLVRAASHPLVHIIGHPTGRIVNKREGFYPDIRALARAAAENRVALEINANWLRLDLRDAHIRAALDAGGKEGSGTETLIAIDCDVHRSEDFDNIRYGVQTARRGGLTAPHCVNTWTAKKLHAWLKAKR